MTEPWRCDHCQQLMYNVRDGKPTAGAPDPKFLDDIHKNVCTLCFELGSVIRWEVPDPCPCAKFS